MAETVKCPHRGAVYEIRYETTAPHDKSAADCQVCGKHMAPTEGSIVPHYELVRMPDGTDV
jgi:hypothetical protein